MTWTARYLADGEMVHNISTHKHDHQAEQALRDFVARIPNPTVQTWWAWIENDDGVKMTLEELDRGWDMLPSYPLEGWTL